MKVRFTTTYQWVQEIPDCDDLEDWIGEHEDMINPGLGDHAEIVDSSYRIVKEGEE